MGLVEKKKVNVRASRPITGIKYPIANIARGITISVEDIRICLQEKAKVEEIVGIKCIPLDFSNYNIDNSGTPTTETTATATVEKIVEVKPTASTTTAKTAVTEDKPTVKVSTETTTKQGTTTASTSTNATATSTEEKK